MNKRRVVPCLLMAAIAITAALSASAFARSSGATKLVGVVGLNDSYKITLKTTSGKLVKKLTPGTYKLVIHDDSSSHNYELDGPNGKSWTFTSVPFTGTKTVTLKLAAGAYKAYCSAHESIMFQHFTVG